MFQLHALTGLCDGRLTAPLPSARLQRSFEGFRPLAAARFVLTRKRVCCCRLQSTGLRKHPAVRLVLRCNVAAMPCCSAWSIRAFTSPHLGGYARWRVIDRALEKKEPSSGPGMAQIDSLAAVAQPSSRLGTVWHPWYRRSPLPAGGPRVSGLRRGATAKAAPGQDETTIHDWPGALDLHLHGKPDPWRIACRPRPCRFQPSRG